MSRNAKIALGAIGALVALTLVATLAVVSYVNNVRNSGIQKEAALVAQYQDNQNYLSNYILSFNESLGIADRQSERLNAILVEAVKGRYDGQMSPGTGGSMFSAISEAYPDLTANTEQYAKVQDLVVSGRNGYKNQQTVLLDRIRDYETWKESGLLRSSVVNMLGFPSERLEARIGDQVWTGSEALDRMKTLVLTSQAISAYQDGQMDPLLSPNPGFDTGASEQSSTPPAVG